jgi:hypothetical protein
MLGQCIGKGSQEQPLSERTQLELTSQGWSVITGPTVLPADLDVTEIQPPFHSGPENWTIVRDPSRTEIVDAPAPTSIENQIESLKSADGGWQSFQGTRNNIVSVRSTDPQE